MNENKVGLEAEFFVLKDGELVYPANYGFGTDDFVLLGEIRAKPGKNRAETISNFLNVWYQAVRKANVQGLVLDISGYKQLSPEKYSEVMRKVGTKSIATCKNIYPGVDLLQFSDAVVEDGKLLQYNTSAGFHIHFSSEVTREHCYTVCGDRYEPVNIPLMMNGTNLAEMSFYQKIAGEDIKKETTVRASRLTKPDVSYIVKTLDEKLLPGYSLDVPLKYRQPGFYEIKTHGFEYRSLPYTRTILDDIYVIVDTAYGLLEGLSL